MANARLNGFLRGWAGMFSFIDVINRRLLAESPAEADAEAIREAWERVGDYMYDALGIYSRTYTVYPDASNENTWQQKKTGEK